MYKNSGIVCILISMQLVGMQETGSARSSLACLSAKQEYVPLEQEGERLLLWLEDESQAVNHGNPAGGVPRSIVPYNPEKDVKAKAGKRGKRKNCKYKQQKRKATVLVATFGKKTGMPHGDKK